MCDADLETLIDWQRLTPVSPMSLQYFYCPWEKMMTLYFSPSLFPLCSRNIISSHKSLCKCPIYLVFGEKVQYWQKQISFKSLSVFPFFHTTVATLFHHPLFRLIEQKFGYAFGRAHRFWWLQKAKLGKKKKYVWGN